MGHAGRFTAVAAFVTRYDVFIIVGVLRDRYNIHFACHYNGTVLTSRKLPVSQLALMETV